MDNKQGENKVEVQLTERIKEVVDDLDIVNIQIDVNTTKKLQKCLLKKEQGQD